jgi:hypothetical protein
VSATAEWRKVPGYRCAASRDGKVRGARNALISGWVDADGYMRVHVLSETVGRFRQVPVHLLVCTAFKGARPSPEHTVAHGDGVRLNNGEANLRWATAAEQYDDRRRHGTHAAIGEANWNAKLSNAEAEVIRREYRPRSRTHGYPALARRYGVSRFVIYRIVRLGGYAARAAGDSQ